MRILRTRMNTYPTMEKFLRNVVLRRKDETKRMETRLETVSVKEIELEGVDTY